MPSRLPKINRHLLRTVGEVLQREADLPPNVLVTVSRVDATPNLKSAKVWLYVNPIEEAEAVLERLKPQMYDIQGAVNRMLDFHPLPRLLFRIDYGADHADKIQRTLAKLHDEEPSSASDDTPADSQ